MHFEHEYRGGDPYKIKEQPLENTTLQTEEAAEEEVTAQREKEFTQEELLSTIAALYDPTHL